MTAPVWMNAVVSEFGRAAGLKDLALNARGAAAFSFETGTSFRLEYTGEELALYVTVPLRGGYVAMLKRLLAFSHPLASFDFRVRTGLLEKSGRALIAVRLMEREVTLPRLNAAFGLLWRLAGEIGGVS